MSTEKLIYKHHKVIQLILVHTVVNSSANLADYVW